MKNIIYETYNEKETFDLGNMIGTRASKGNIYCLYGDLGVGKTVFVKGFAKGLNIKEEILSPTFTIIKRYTIDDINLYHFDLYRIEQYEELEYLCFDEYLYGDNISLIEWPEKIEEYLQGNIIKISINKNLKKGNDYREIIINGDI